MPYIHFFFFFSKTSLSTFFTLLHLRAHDEFSPNSKQLHFFSISQYERFNQNEIFREQSKAMRIPLPAVPFVMLAFD